jgi:hypothetical protein
MHTGQHVQYGHWKTWKKEVLYEFGFQFNKIFTIFSRFYAVVESRYSSYHLVRRVTSLSIVYSDELQFELYSKNSADHSQRRIIILRMGSLDISTARYFYKRLKTSLHKPRDNLLENLFSKKCAFKINLQLLEKKFLSQTNTTPQNGILL